MRVTGFVNRPKNSHCKIAEMLARFVQNKESSSYCIKESNHHPSSSSQWWKLGPEEQVSYEAFLRRVTESGESIEEVAYKDAQVHGIQTQVQEPSQEEGFQEDLNLCGSPRSSSESWSPLDVMSVCDRP